MGSDDLQDRFNEDPELVMEKFGLDASEKQVVYTMDIEKIAPVVQGQIEAFNDEVGVAKPKHFPDCDLPGAFVGPEVMYPSPTPGVYLADPGSMTREEVEKAGERVNLTIWGKSFCRKPPPTVRVRRLSPARTWDIDVSGLGGSFRCSELYVVVEPAPRETTVREAKYKLILSNNGVDLESSKPFDFEVIP
jgi:hypothetical protein